MWSDSLVSALYRLLPVDEREAVEGDLVELGVTGLGAVREVAWLVIRRQLAAWADWRPWLVLSGLVLPTGIILSFVSRWWADVSAIPVFYYVNWWTWLQLTIPGARHLLLDNAIRILVQFLTLAGWAWSVGFAAGSFSRRTAAVMLVIFCLAIWGATGGTTTTFRDLNGEVFGLTVYGLIYPALVRIVFVVFPAIAGIRQAARSGSGVWRAALVAIGITVLTGYVATGVQSSLTTGRLRVPRDAWRDRLVGLTDTPHPWRGLPIVLVSPALCVVIDRCRRRAGSRSPAI